MNNQKSKYNSTENLKITYYLGAGASYNSIPILNSQGYSIVDVARVILDKLNSQHFLEDERLSVLYQNKKLTRIAKNLENFGRKAQEYGSIDIYARRLYLLDERNELENLKFCLSIYFDLWEEFCYLGRRIGDTDPLFPQINHPSFSKIDKRYFSLLSVLLDKSQFDPKLNESVSFVSWNYDLQLEMTYRSFMKDNCSSLEQINTDFKFMNDSVSIERSDVVHLNGFRGVFKHKKKFYSNVEKTDDLTIEDYLLGLIENDRQFRMPSPSYKDCIKYAWEADSSSLEKAKKIMSETVILVIIGYSFPSFNRKIDSELIKEFESTGYYKIIYQDPNANQDIIDSLFSNPKDVKVERETPLQFHIPPEFLSPTNGEEISFGV